MAPRKKQTPRKKPIKRASKKWPTRNKPSGPFIRDGWYDWLMRGGHGLSPDAFDRTRELRNLSRWFAAALLINNGAKLYLDPNPDEAMARIWERAKAFARIVQADVERKTGGE